MTVLEAIELLKEMQERCKIPTATDPKRFAKSDAVDIAFKALEKQIPKKPLNIQDHILLETKDYDYSNADCPNCGEVFSFDETFKPLYCSNCGQKIDWSELEE